MRQRFEGLLYDSNRAADGRDLARARLLVVGSFINLAALAAMFVGSLVTQRPLDGAIAAVGFLAFALTLLALRRSRSFFAATTLFCAAETVVVVSAAVVLGDVVDLIWLGVLPTLALVMLDARRAVQWLVLISTVAGGAAFYVGSVPGLMVVPSLAVLVARLLVFVACMLALGIWFRGAEQSSRNALDLARNEVQRVTALRGHFLSSFSHEIRTPLNGVLGTAEIMLASPCSPEQHEQLLLIQRSGSTLLRSINDILEFSRIEAGHVESVATTTNLEQLLGDAIGRFEQRAVSLGLLLSLEIEPGCPRHVSVDDLRLRQIVENLLSNAVKFSPPGGTVKLRLDAEPSEGAMSQIRISVKDAGPGIPPESHETIFEPFGVARGQNVRSLGSGLGLAISKQFVELMGGTLRLRSESGRGSTFTVELRCAVVDGPVPTPSNPVAASVRVLTALVVDDNEINLTVASALIRKLGHLTILARDGQQAIDAVAAHRPDIVFMDVHMPVMDGLQAVAHLRAAGDTTPIVALTAAVFEEDRRRCREAGMDHFLSKPVSMVALQKVLVAAVPPVVTPSRNSRVLVVEDDQRLRRMTVRVLRAEGYEVMDAADVESALTLFDRAPPDVLVVDRVLGGPVNGLQLAEQLVQRQGSLKVILTSGHTPTALQMSSLAALGGRFLPKPYDRFGLVPLVAAPRALPSTSPRTPQVQAG